MQRSVISIHFHYFIFNFGSFLPKTHKCTKVLCISRRELSNEYLLAKFGFVTAENELCKICGCANNVALAPQLSVMACLDRVLERLLQHGEVVRGLHLGLLAIRPTFQDSEQKYKTMLHLNKLHTTDDAATFFHKIKRRTRA